MIGTTQAFYALDTLTTQEVILWEGDSGVLPVFNVHLAQESIRGVSKYWRDPANKT